MKRTCGWLIFVALLALLPEGVAAQRSERRTLGQDLEHLAGDAFHVWSAPFGPAAKDLEGVLVVAGLFGSALVADQAVMDWVRARRSGLLGRAADPFGERSPASKIGRTHVLTSLAAVIYLSGVVFNHNGLRDAGLGCATANVTAMLPRATMSRLLGRARPLVNEGPYAFRFLAFDDWDWRSFPTGHGSNAMSCASYLNHRFDLGLASPLFYGVAGAIGFVRMFDDAHWASDTVFGLSWGFAVGKAVGVRARRRAEAGSETNDTRPTLYLSWRTSF